MNEKKSVRNLQTHEPAWQFYLLGGLNIFHAGVEIAAPPHRVLGLLAALLLNAQRLHRVYLAGLLNPDQSEDNARRRLSDRLWLLRSALPDLPLETSGDYVSITAESRWVDVEAFKFGVMSDRLHPWQEAIKLYRGELLPGVYDEWLLLERENLRLQWLNTLHRTSQVLIERKDYQGCLPQLQRLVQAEPLDEGAVRTLMRVYATLGQRGAALSAYERFTSHAANELGIQPEPATQSIAESLYDARAPLTAKSVPEGVDPSTILQQARQALVRSDHIAVDAYLTHLRTHPPDVNGSDVCLFEVDYALEAMQYDKANKLLLDLDPDLLSVQIRLAKLALEQGKSSSAQEQASQVLLRAHEENYQEIELESLLVLAQTQRRLGDMVPALINAERAFNLAQQLNSPKHIVSALLAQGWIMIRQGRYREALAMFQRAQSQSQEFGLRGELAKVLYGISLVRIYRGDFLEAKETVREALDIWRDLGLVENEVRALTRLSHISGQLGENEEALHTLELARQIGAKLNDPLVNANNQYNLAAALPYHDEGQVARAIALVEDALKVFRSHKQTGWEAATLATLGYNLWVAGDYERANAVLKDAYDLHKKLGEVGVLPELMAYQGLALLGLDSLEDAVECTRGALLALAQSTVDNDIISEIYYAHAAVLDAQGEDDEAQEYFTRAYNNLLKYAQQLDDESARQAFFQRDPTVRRLMKEIFQRGIAPLPDAGVVRRWVRSRTGQPIRVAWTFDAGPPDVALKRSRGAVGLRRARLTRILRESTSQGASPTINQLADTLGVSTRTVKRDLAKIRADDNDDN